MKHPLLLIACSITSISQAQYLLRNFDPGWPNDLPLVIDTTAGNLWQMGAPQKAFFNAAHSSPNVIVTDTIDPCPPGNTSRFTLKLPTMNWGWWPEFFVHFEQAFQMDSLHAGGFIEISYDTGATWMNVFEDWVNPPNVQLVEEGVGDIQPDTLSNGQIGFTGSSGSSANGMHWVWSSFCWVQSGIPLADTLLLRFTSYTDSLAQPLDGWMIDDIEYMVYIAHPISEYLRKDHFLVTAPNPMTDRLYIAYDTDGPDVPVHLALYDMDGRLVRTLVDEVQQQGMHNLICWRKDLPDGDGILHLAAWIGDEQHVEKILLSGR